MEANVHLKLRIGSVPFLNAKPLIRYLSLSGLPPAELTLEVPSRLAPLLADGKLDVALLPSVEYLRASDYKILSDVCIASDGIVESVKVFSKAPIDRIKSLALDTSSRTSAALVQILLKKRYGGLPELSECAPDAALSDIKEDAFLLIGDPAMKFQADCRIYTLDLGEEWKRQTGHPFVYALWVARSGIELGDLGERLAQAREAGLANLHRISSEASMEIGLDEGRCLNYLRDSIYYRLGERELKGLSLFQRLAAESGLCPGDVEIAIRYS